MVLVKDFYADPQRASSQEVDFGSEWRTQGHGPWKVVWLQATGELVAFSEHIGLRWSTDRLGRGMEAVGALFGDYGAVWDSDDEVVVIGVVPDLARLRGVLLGWQDHMPEENGLAWLAERVDEVIRGRAR